MGVPDSKNQEVGDMDVDETSDNDTGWEDIVVGASGDLNPSRHLEVIPIEKKHTEIQVIHTNNLMISRTP